MTQNLSEWTARPRPGFKTLAGRYARLEPYSDSRHADTLYRAVAGPENAHLWRFLQSNSYSDPESFRVGLSNTADAYGREVMVIGPVDEETILGMASFMRIREAHGSVEVGAVVFNETLKRTRMASEAIFLMAAHVFDDLGYRRFEWKCHSLNVASRRSAERFGFAFEGLFRNDMVIKGESRDTAWFAMTDADWPLVRARFTAWLDPANFDAGGHQRQPLAAC